MIGKNIIFEDRVQLIGINNESKQFEIGDNVYIGEDVKIIGQNIKIMDYTKVHNHTFIYAPKPIEIGYNCWIGSNVILNAEETLTIQNNVCIASHSQLWTHIRFGDTLQGCRFNRRKKMLIEDDVWIGGNCFVAAIHAERKSMALGGSVIVKNMKENHVYAGSPAKDITDKIGHQFDNISIETKYILMEQHLNKFLNGKKNKQIQIVMEYPEKQDLSITYFNVSNRTYTKRNTEIEQRFMKYLLPEKGKFIPYD